MGRLREGTERESWEFRTLPCVTPAECQGLTRATGLGLMGKEKPLGTGASRGFCVPLDPRGQALPLPALRIREEQEGAAEKEKPQNNLQLPADGNRYDLADKHR